MTNLTDKDYISTIDSNGFTNADPSGTTQTLLRRRAASVLRDAEGAVLSMKRRDLLLGAGLAGTASVIGGMAREGHAADVAVAVRSRARRPDPRVLPSRIAFGSCAKENKQQPIWDAINAAEPDLFIFLGDNIYADTRDESVLRDKYGSSQRKPGFRGSARECRSSPSGTTMTMARTTPAPTIR